MNTFAIKMQCIEMGRYVTKIVDFFDAKMAVTFFTHDTVQVSPNFFFYALSKKLKSVYFGVFENIVDIHL